MLAPLSTLVILFALLPYLTYTFSIPLVTNTNPYKYGSYMPPWTQFYINQHEIRQSFVHILNDGSLFWGGEIGFATDYPPEFSGFPLDSFLENCTGTCGLGMYGRMHVNGTAAYSKFFAGPTAPDSLKYTTVGDCTLFDASNETYVCTGMTSTNGIGIEDNSRNWSPYVAFFNPYTGEYYNFVSFSTNLLPSGIAIDNLDDSIWIGGKVLSSTNLHIFHFDRSLGQLHSFGIAVIDDNGWEEIFKRTAIVAHPITGINYAVPSDNSRNTLFGSLYVHQQNNTIGYRYSSNVYSGATVTSASDSVSQRADDSCNPEGVDRVYFAYRVGNNMQIRRYLDNGSFTSSPNFGWGSGSDNFITSCDITCNNEIVCTGYSASGTGAAIPPAPSSNEIYYDERFFGWIGRFNATSLAILGKSSGEHTANQALNFSLNPNWMIFGDPGGHGTPGMRIRCGNTALDCVIVAMSDLSGFDSQPGQFDHFLVFPYLARAGEYVSYVDNSNVRTSKPCPVGSVSTAGVIEGSSHNYTSCVVCTNNSFPNSQGTQCVCSTGFMRDAVPSQPGSSCVACPSYIDCPGGDIDPSPHPGYMKFPKDSFLDVKPCPLGLSCPGGSSPGIILDGFYADLTNVINIEQDGLWGIDISTDIHPCIAGGTCAGGSSQPVPTTGFFFDQTEQVPTTILQCPKFTVCDGGLALPIPINGYSVAGTPGADDYQVFECPGYLSCVEGETLPSSAGYSLLAASSNSTKFWGKCYPSEACEKPSAESPTRCAKEYTGDMCSECNESAYRQKDGTCKTCDTSVNAWIYFIVLIFGLSVAMIGLIITSQNARDSYHKQAGRRFLIILGIVFSFGQSISILSDGFIQSNSSNFISSFYNSFQWMTLGLDQFFSFNCMTTEVTNPLDSFIFRNTLPFIVLLNGLFLFGIVALIKHYRFKNPYANINWTKMVGLYPLFQYSVQNDYSVILKRFGMGVVRFLLLIHATVTMNVLQSFICVQGQCKEFSEPSNPNSECAKPVMVMATSPDVRCDSDNYIGYLSYNIFMLIFFVIGFPLSFIAFFVKQKEWLALETTRFEFDSIFGFLRHENVFYWPIVPLIRRAALVLAALQWVSDAELVLTFGIWQTGFQVLVILLSLTSIIVASPYSDPSINHLDELLQTLLLGLVSVTSFSAFVSFWSSSHNLFESDQVGLDRISSIHLVGDFLFSFLFLFFLSILLFIVFKSKVRPKHPASQTSIPLAPPFDLVEYKTTIRREKQQKRRASMDKGQPIPAQNDKDLIAPSKNNRKSDVFAAVTSRTNYSSATYKYSGKQTSVEMSQVNTPSIEPVQDIPDVPLALDLSSAPPPPLSSSPPEDDISPPVPPIPSSIT